jgi:hypothetical protein
MVREIREYWQMRLLVRGVGWDYKRAREARRYLTWWSRYCFLHNQPKVR